MSTIPQETLAAMAIARTGHFNISLMRELYRRAGSFKAITDNHDNIRDIIPDCPQRLITTLKNISPIISRTEEEAAYITTHGIQPICISDDSYPQRLKECEDAPLVLFYKGTADLNCKRVINIVGTRHATIYADDFIRQFTERMKELCPQLLIVSGLAYGVDIMAHRHSLENGIPTVGVLAHGLDNLYPPRHRETANRMAENGGLLTEHFTRTNADKVNFVRRNRIVAGMSDATILIESASHGGGLITCSMAQGYGRDVFAVPGRVGDTYSEGCNNLIRDNGAQLLTSADDLVNAMGWEADAKLATAQRQGIERTLFPHISGNARLIVDNLDSSDMQLNMLATKTGLPMSDLTATLFELEMQGIVKALAGGTYHLIK